MTCKWLKISRLDFRELKPRPRVKSCVEQQNIWQIRDDMNKIIFQNKFLICVCKKNQNFKQSKKPNSQHCFNLAINRAYDFKMSFANFLCWCFIFKFVAIAVNSVYVAIKKSSISTAATTFIVFIAIVAVWIAFKISKLRENFAFMPYFI